MSASSGISKFDKFFKKMVSRTCKEWGYELPSDEYYENIYERLPIGLREVIASGLSSKLIMDIGLSKSKSAAFRLSVLPDTKGPYSWFEHNNKKGQPQPCWEYFVQIGEFTRLYELFKDKKTELKFEDDLMDIGIYRNKKLWVCCEIKEKSSQAKNLIRGIKKYQDVSNLPEKDRGNDPLRKAKYIVKQKPSYFYLVALGRRYEFRIEYPENMQFKMIEDLIPLM